MNISSNRISVSINDNTDLTFLFILLKHAINLDKFLPQSVYYIKSDGYSITKIKKSFSQIRLINYWNFLDIMNSNYDEVAVSSEQSIGGSIIGWEIRYAVKTNIEEEFFINIEKGYEGLINKLKNMQND